MSAATPTPRPPAWRPGDERPDIASMIRVDQAGEYGATRIYCGQLAVLGARHARRRLDRAACRRRRRGTSRHFDEMMVERGIRPTLLQPFWPVAGHALGAATALIEPGRRDGLHRRGRDRDRPPLFRAARGARRRRARPRRDHRRASRPRSSSIATPRSRPAPRRRSAIRLLSRPSARAAVPPSHFRRGSEPMKPSCSPPLAAATRVCRRRRRRPTAPGDAQEPRINQLIVYGNDPCPREQRATRSSSAPASPRPSATGSRQVCATIPTIPGNQSWADRATALEYVGRTGTGSCRPVGAGRLHRLLQPDHPPGPRRARGADDVNWTRLIEQAREARRRRAATRRRRRESARDASGDALRNRGRRPAIRASTS